MTDKQKAFANAVKKIKADWRKTYLSPKNDGNKKAELVYKAKIIGADSILQALSDTLGINIETDDENLEDMIRRLEK